MFDSFSSQAVGTMRSASASQSRSLDSFIAEGAVLIVDVAADYGVVEFVDLAEEFFLVGVEVDYIALVFFGEGYELGVGVGGGNDDAVGVGYGGFHEVFVVEVLEHA